MRQKGFLFFTLLVTAVALVLPGAAEAQLQAGISGQVTDETGGVLPGVTVSASSPATIDVRVAVTDGEGRYSLVSLTPGTYAVEYGLPGFSTVRREGLELTSGFNANVDIQMGVGGVEETVTVTGATPTVDIQNVQTQPVLNEEVLDLLPNAQTIGAFAALTLGVRISGVITQDVGGSSGEMGSVSVHNNRAVDQKITMEGMNTNNAMGTNGGVFHAGQHYNMEAMQEVAMGHSGMSAETETAGMNFNYIPKDGGNQMSGSSRFTWTGESFQGENIGDDLIARGVNPVAPTSVKRIFDMGGSLGGPIVSDRVWFFTATRWWGDDIYRVNSFFNSIQGQTAPNGRPLYEPSSVRGFWRNENFDASGRITMQLSPKDKLTYNGNYGRQCICYLGAGAVVAPEASSHNNLENNHLSQVTYTRAHSNSILVEAGLSVLINPFTFRRESNSLGTVGPNDFQVRDFVFPSTGAYFIYNGRSSGGIPYNGGDPSAADQRNARGSLSYVTGSHNFKFGGQWAHGWVVQNGSNNEIPGFGPAMVEAIAGNPFRVTVFSHPKFNRADFRNMAFYAQDQWTLDRVTVNLGLRADFFTGWAPDQTSPASVFVPAFDVSRTDAQSWQDISPRMGVAYDILGDGTTAFKATAGRYVGAAGAGNVQPVNPASAIDVSTRRNWTDANDNWFPEGDVTNPEPNGEFTNFNSDVTFGLPVITRFFDPDVLEENRPYTWQFSAGVDRELMENVRLSVTYFRTMHYNQTVNDNENLDPSHFDTFSVTVPAGVPGAGAVVGNQANRTFGSLGIIPRTVTKNAAASFGNHSEVYNGVDIETQARFSNGALLTGGVGIGKTVNDDCFTVDSPADLYQCRVITPWWAGNGQIKLAGSYPLPYGIEVSGVFQHIAADDVKANVTFTNDQIATSLGRNLSACPAPTGPCTATVSVQVLEPNAEYEDRFNQLDFRIAKVFEFGTGMRARLAFDLYNIFNGSPVLARNDTYGLTGAGYGRPNVILGARLIKLGAQFNWN